MGAKGNRTIRNTARIHAVAYMRTSSATNVGADKDSDKRQRAAIQRFAKAAGYVIAEADWYYDAAVSGADPIETRKGFDALLQRIEDNGVRVVIVESADRFARELMAQELGIVLLRTRGVTLLTASGDDMTASDDPLRTMLRQITGAFAEYEKARLVSKLREARERSGKLGGRLALRDTNPEAAKLAKKLRRAAPSFGLKPGKRLSLRDIAGKLAEAGFTTTAGKPYSPSMVKRLLGEE
ncbi:MAG: recombinase family protein [Hyphomicrobiaceae bacterium]